MPGSGSGGAGLGLYIAKEITMAHGARLSLQSEAGHGSLFSIELPTASAASRARCRRPEPIAPPNRG